MSRRELLGEYELSTSGLGFGTAGLFHEPSKAQRRAVLESALDAGVIHFDVAPIYGLGLAEGELGRAVRRRRHQVILATKVGIGLTPLARVLGRVQSPARSVLQKVPSLQHRARSSAASPTSGKLGSLLYKSTFQPEMAQRSLDQSLRDFGTDHLDLLLLHDPQPSHFASNEVYELLEQARSAGKIRSWGVAGELEPTMAVIEQFPGPTPVIQIRDDIFRGDEYVTLPAKSEYLITFGVLGHALPTIVAHVRANAKRTKQWNDAVGADCASPGAVASLLIKDALRANELGTVLYSTTRPQRVRDTVALVKNESTQPDSSLAAFRQLVASQLGKSDGAPKDDQ